MRTSVLLFCLSLSACTDPRGPVDASALPDVPHPELCTVPAAQGLSQECCPAFGVDACGAGLFCAMFDGRTIPTCYANGSRLDGDQCFADAQCASNSCNIEARACRATSGSCEPAIGCAPSGAEARVCAPDTDGYSCFFVGDGTEGSHCLETTDCLTDLTCDATARICVGPCGVECETFSDCPSFTCECPGGSLVINGDCRTDPASGCDVCLNPENCVPFCP